MKASCNTGNATENAAGRSTKNNTKPGQQVEQQLRLPLSDTGHAGQDCEEWVWEQHFMTQWTLVAASACRESIEIATIRNTLTKRKTMVRVDYSQMSGCQGAGSGSGTDSVS